MSSALPVSTITVTRTLTDAPLGRCALGCGAPAIYHYRATSAGTAGGSGIYASTFTCGACSCGPLGEARALTMYAGMLEAQVAELEAADRRRDRRRRLLNDPNERARVMRERAGERATDGLPA